MRTVQPLLALALVAAPFTASATPDVKKDAPPATTPAPAAPAAPARGPMAPVTTKLAVKHDASTKAAAPHRHHAAVKRTAPAGK